MKNVPVRTGSQAKEQIMDLDASQNWRINTCEAASQ